MHRFLRIGSGLAIGIAVMGCLVGCAKGSGKLKIGFIVKRPEEQWFQDEWRFAHQAGDKYGFEIIELGAPNPDDVSTAIDNLNAQGAKGFVICTPDVKLGPSIVLAAKKYNLKVMSVDDQLIDADGKPLDVPHMGISAHDIGFGAGQALYAEMKKRGWKPEETGFMVPTFDQLPTARERTDGATEAMIKAGYPKDHIYTVAQAKSDQPSGLDAGNIAITQHPNVKKWLVCGMNDEAVLGAVRALENRGLKADNVIGVGIGGTKTAQDEFAKSEPTGFFGTMLISPKRHGYETSELMYKWITSGAKPPQTTFTTGILITRSDYKQRLHEQGLDEQPAKK